MNLMMYLRSKMAPMSTALLGRPYLVGSFLACIQTQSAYQHDWAALSKTMILICKHNMPAFQAGAAYPHK